MKKSIQSCFLSKNVLHIINSLRSGGAESTLVNYLIEAKNTFNKTMEVAVYHNDTYFTSKLIKENIPVNVLKSKRKYSIKALWNTVQLLRREKYDIVFAQLFPTNLYIALSSYFFPKISYILRVTTEKTRRRNFPIFKLVDKFIYSRYDTIICVDDIVEKSLISWVKNVQGKTIVVTKGVPVPHIQKNIKKKYDIIFVGRLCPPKNVGMLFAAIKILKQSNTIKRVAIVGDGPLMSQLTDMAHTLNIEDVVHFLGDRNDITRQLQMSKIFVLPSLWEGTPSALLEAMAVGLPVIATKVGGISKIIDHLSDGILIPSNDVDSLVKAVKKIIANTRFAKDMGNNAQAKIKQHYSVTSYTKKLLFLLNTVKSRRK